MAAAELGPPDILVNNASVMRVGPLHAMNEADFQEAPGVMFWGTVHTTLAALSHMRERSGGNIVNVASIGAAPAIGRPGSTTRPPGSSTRFPGSESRCRPGGDHP
jgi:NAD(P)-dependent dehydrogenase (short-subunit alcohol dehydrogenase family)